MKILVTGDRGLVGSAIKNVGKDTEHEFFFLPKEVDLTRQNVVESYFSQISPDVVIHAAGRVGGIGRNLNTPAQQFVVNTLMNTIVLETSRRIGVRRLIAFGSACAFPSDILIYSEKDLHKGEPFLAHKSYAYSKRMVDIQLESYVKEYKLDNYISFIPPNIFGPNDNFNLEDGHVVPSLIRKCFEAKNTNKKFVIWGDGSAQREFVYSYDIARIVLKSLEYEFSGLNTSYLIPGQSLTIKEIVNHISDAFGYYDVEWDTSKPVGQIFRASNPDIFNSKFGQFNFTPIKDSILETCKWYEGHYEFTRN